MCNIAKVTMSRNIRIKGKSKVVGAIRVPGDKSISHRVAMLSAIARGASTISGFASSADCQATLDCVKRLGVVVEREGENLIVHGNGLRGFKPPNLPAKLFVGNSGSTIRMLSGLLAGQPFASEIDGDASIRRRPMGRIIGPLRMMGSNLVGREENFAPLRIQGGKLRAIDYASPVASAQVKTCVLFAGLFADGVTSVKEPALSRNHSELMLEEFGAPIHYSNTQSSIEGGVELKPVNYRVPGDVSSAAFFAAAASILPDSQMVIEGVNLNETRTAFLDVLNELGASIKFENVTKRHGEPVGDLHISSGDLRTGKDGLLLSGSIIPNLIDEIPILAVVGTQIEGRLEVRDAKELRIKESDRIKTVAAGLRQMGCAIEEFEDGFAISGKQRLTPARIETAGDHRIAMAFAVAALLAEGETEIIGADCAEVSFPEFYQLLSQVCDAGTVS